MSQIPSDKDPRVNQLREMIQASPLLLPWDWDQISGRIEFISLTESEYLQASFLDERMLSEKSIRGTVPYALISDIDLSHRSSIGSRPCDFIFHVSHCGSTLLSRLLGSHPVCFALREPRVLRSFRSQSPEEIRWLFGLLSRTFSQTQRALIKSTSFTSQFAQNWLSVLQDSKAILLTMPLEPFLAAVLDGSTIDIQNHKHSRWKRLQNLGCHLPGELDTLEVGQCAAMSWLCESLTLHKLASNHPSRTHSIDFDSLIRSPAQTLEQCAEFLNYPSPYPDWDRDPLWQQYAKKPGVSYNTLTRDKLLNASRQKHAAEIQQGIRWVLTLQDPQVADLLNR